MQPAYTEMPWTPGEWIPERNPATYNEIGAYQKAIIQKTNNGRIIPGFAFGESAEQCEANAWLLAASKEMLRSLQKYFKLRHESETRETFINSLLNSDWENEAYQTIMKALNQLP